MTTYSTLHFSPAYVLAWLELRRVIANDSLKEDLRLPRAEMPHAEKRHGVERGIREQGKEYKPNQDSKNTLNLII